MSSYPARVDLGDLLGSFLGNELAAGFYGSWAEVDSLIGTSDSDLQPRPTFHH